MLKLSIDDGAASDIRIADLCNKYEIDCVFYWPVEWRSLAYDNGYEPLNIVQAISIANQFEIGSHTVTHRHLTKISYEEARVEISDSKFMLEALFAKPVTKFAPPRGYSNEQLTEFTDKLYESQRLTRGENLVHIHPNSGANDNRPWQNVYQEKVEQGLDVECWGHSWEFDRFNLWGEIEEVLSGTHS